MPHNSTTAQEKWTNFSRRFRRESSGYFSQRGSSTEASASSPSDALSPNSLNSKQTQYTPSPLASEGVTSSSNNANERDSLATSRTLSSQFNLRPPIGQRRFENPIASTKEFVLPDLPWLCGTWHICASSLPMWKDKRNVRVEYTRILKDRLDDTVSYQNRDNTTIQKVHGIDKPKKNGAFSWRGKGRLSVASSRWEILGWGGGGPKSNGTAGPNGIIETAAPKRDWTEQWVVTYYARTLFTEAGIDIYSRKSTGLSPEVMRKLKIAINRLGGGGTAAPRNEFERIARQIVDVRHDGERNDLVQYEEVEADLGVAR